MKEEVDVPGFLLDYHWRELPQVSVLSRQKTCFVATKVSLSRQNYVCHGKIMFFATNTGHKFVCVCGGGGWGGGLRPKYVCRDKNDTCGSSWRQ